MSCYCPKSHFPWWRNGLVYLQLHVYLHSVGPKVKLTFPLQLEVTKLQRTRHVFHV